MKKPFFFFLIGISLREGETIRSIVSAYYVTYIECVSCNVSFLFFFLYRMLFLVWVSSICWLWYPSISSICSNTSQKMWNQSTKISRYGPWFSQCTLHLWNILLSIQQWLYKMSKSVFIIRPSVYQHWK